MNVTTYIAGYIVRKLKDKVCGPCLKLLSSPLDADNKSHDFLKLKLYEDAVTGLTVPSKKLVDVVTEVEVVYRQVIETVLAENAVMAKLVNAVCGKVDLSTVTCGTCRMERAIVGLMLRIRLHHSLKTTNERCSNTVRKNRKTIKFSNL